ncbi:MAG: TrmH family RNA methyltransferase [Clostridia bacterium]|nr:TrmH family RNA methyltransferase [Clostridia bacterium]
MSYTVKRYKKENDESYTLGTTLTIELLKYKPEKTKIVLLHSQIDGEGGKRIVELCEKNGIPYETNDKAFNILSQKENCFAIGVFEKFEERINPDTDHIVLVNPSNSGNLGTIIRSSLGFGMRDLAIITPAVDVFDPKTVRSSMGAVFSLRISHYSTFNEYIQSVSKRNCYPFMLQAKFSLDKAEFVRPASLVFGNESSGLPDNFLKVGDPVIIKHTDSIDSLNLPTAVGIALYKFTEGKF